MAKRRPGFDRRPTGPVSARRLPDRAAAAAAARRRNVALTAAFSGAIGVLLLGFAGGLWSPAASPSPSLGTAAPAPTRTPAAASATPQPTPTIGGSGPVISGVACDVDEGTVYHVHSHLNIRFEGELQPIPADIGILGACLYWLHTHSNQGVIHVEAPAQTTFTLGQFFDVWGQPLSVDQVGGRGVGSGESLFVFVDRQPYQGDPRTIELGDLVAIELQVGAAALEPLPYTFPAEFE